MKKQEFLDKTEKTNQETATLQLMLGMSKTQLLTLKRHLNMADKTLYTTSMKAITFAELNEAVTEAFNYHEYGQNTVEN